MPPKPGSLARALFGGGVGPRPSGPANTTPATRTPDYYRDNPNYPYPRETFPPPPEDWTGSRGRHRPTGLPAYPIPPDVIPRGEEGFYSEDPDAPGLVVPRFPPEWDADIARDDDDTHDEVLGGLVGGAMTPGEVNMMSRTMPELSEEQRGHLQRLFRERVGAGRIAPDPYAPRQGIDRYLPGP